MMISTVAIKNYRSILDLVLPLDRLTAVHGANGVGKSNLYRALRLLASTARDGLISSIASEGGLSSILWAEPERISPRMERGEVAVQGTLRKGPVRMVLGFAADDFGYSIALGPGPSTQSLFSLDPEIKRECIWAGPIFRPAAVLVDRAGAVVRVRRERSWEVICEDLPPWTSLFAEVAHNRSAPEVLALRNFLYGWRFYDYLRSDREAPARFPQLGTRTPILHADGRDVAAALQTIMEIGDRLGLHTAIEDAFPGSTLKVVLSDAGKFALTFHQPGLLRTLGADELSDGTLRYLMLLAALFSPRPPPLMVLNEPETSLHPSLLPALSKAVVAASQKTQIVVVSHAADLLEKLSGSGRVSPIKLEKNLGRTQVVGQEPLTDRPAWSWIE